MFSLPYIVHHWNGTGVWFPYPWKAMITLSSRGDYLSIKNSKHEFRGKKLCHVVETGKTI